jgi:four helix bundle protein
MFDTEVFKLMRSTSALVWQAVKPWDWFAKDVIGRQWVKSTESVGANLVEGDARGSDQDALRFFVIARASLDESLFWAGSAADKSLIDEATATKIISNLEAATRMLDGLISYRKRSIGTSKVHESLVSYSSISVPSAMELDDERWPHEPLSKEPESPSPVFNNP